MSDDEEADRFAARARRYANLGVTAGALAARAGARKLIGGDSADAARDLTRALGALKGPLMKVAQMMATIPDALPADYADQLISLQSQAPPMGAAFVRRRMQAELGPEWRARFAEFDLAPAAAASLGQVHRAIGLDGEALACKLQYPDMSFGGRSRSVATRTAVEVPSPHGTGDRHQRNRASRSARALREELDYEREAKLMRLYGAMLADRPRVRMPKRVRRAVDAPPADACNGSKASR